MASCPLCGADCDPHLLAQSATLRPAIAAHLHSRHPAWSMEQGACPTCVAETVTQFAARRTVESLHTRTDPPTTFPYYHPDEETVLPQPLRLPAHAGYDGAGITIAFLDSGYYPHPDLSSVTVWPDPPDWPRLNEQELRRVISAVPTRLLDYIDLTDDGQVEGLDAPSLWDGAGDSWHGQMTTAVAAGNGLLSDGDYRGLAPAASILPIKIGRGGGRIPEADILRGLNWLLEEDRWARYGVRVLNVSVGGDFVEPWHVNPVCLAAEELARRGVVIAAAAGNSAREHLLAPAQAPSVITVGGVDDGNRRRALDCAAEIATLALYPHNWSLVGAGHALIRKPEVLALGRWLPSPVLPPSSVFDEMAAIGRLRARLERGGPQLVEIAAHWSAALYDDPVYRRRTGGAPLDWRSDLWRSLRKRMNAHKWIHPYYQHVDGSSVAVAQVSALVAQMIQANPRLTPPRVKALLESTALPLPHTPPERSGAGLIQPARAVAAALRAGDGPLAGLPQSGTRPALWPDAPTVGKGEAAVYVGLWAPHAVAVSVLGSFNGWQPGRLQLARTRGGWWHARLCLPPGRHAYRFWVVSGDSTPPAWLPDPENPIRGESGYRDDHTIAQGATA